MKHFTAPIAAYLSFLENKVPQKKEKKKKKIN